MTVSGHALVLACGTSTTNTFGVGPVIAATVVGITGDTTRFPTADRFAAYAGTCGAQELRSSGEDRDHAA